MATRNLMVHLDGSARTAARLELATALARRDKARLVGVFAQRAVAEQVGAIVRWPPREYAADAAASEAAFRKATQKLPDAEWFDVNRGRDAEVVYRVAGAARYFDLAILGQYDGSPDPKAPPELPEEVVLNSGRPALMLPYVGDYALPFRRPLIAWNNSREAAHALNDALPLIEGCKEALVLSIDAHAEEAERSCAAVTRHLSSHGVRTATEILAVEGVGVMDMLLNRAADHGADLLVMGAHGGLGLPFASRGAGTRHILRSMTLPVLMSN